MSGLPVRLSGPARAQRWPRYKRMGVERGQRQYKGLSLLLRREVAAGPWLRCLCALFAREDGDVVARHALIPHSPAIEAGAPSTEEVAGPGACRRLTLAGGTRCCRRYHLSLSHLPGCEKQV